MNMESGEKRSKIAEYKIGNGERHSGINSPSCSVNIYGFEEVVLQIVATFTSRDITRRPTIVLFFG